VGCPAGYHWSCCWNVVSLDRWTVEQKLVRDSGRGRPKPTFAAKSDICGRMAFRNALEYAGLTGSVCIPPDRGLGAARNVGNGASTSGGGRLTVWVVMEII
jgi:hypothetical protein